MRIIWPVRGIKMLKILYFMLTMQLVISCESCGPGKTGLKRRHPKKFLPPLVLKQHIPDVPEFSYKASGLPEGKISRKNPRFKQDLVRVRNPDIIFRDEERTGADRYMTRRCKEKLEILSVMVMNHWPGVQLVVTEGWDEDGQHRKQSLHYEGRSIDIRLQPSDRKKYGTLGRLAVDAGFDWVFYESKAHIHCSCRSENAEFIFNEKMGGCFHANTSFVIRQIPSGTETISMRDIRLGDKVLATEQTSGQPVFSEVIAWLDSDSSSKTVFHRIVLDNGYVLKLTPTHLLQAVSPEKNSTLFGFVRDLSPGDFLLTVDPAKNSSMARRQIRSITQELSMGSLAPLTRHGTIIVNNISASCYAALRSAHLAHSVFAPLRWWTQLRNPFFKYEEKRRIPQGVHPYAKFLRGLSKYVLPKGYLFEEVI